MGKIFAKITHKLSTKAFSDRITIYIAMLTAFAIIPNILVSFVQLNWTLLVIDSALIVICIVIAYAVFRAYRVLLMQFILGILISIGMLVIGIIGDGDQLFWMFPSIVALFFLLKPNVALLFCMAIHVISSPFLLDMDPSTSKSYLIATILTVFFVYFCARELRLQHANLNTLATEDFLTQTGNRRAFQHDADNCIANFRRHKIGCSLILFDMDHFKRLNDSFGHHVGDKVLKSTSKLVEQRLRRTDRLYRLGGEEFAILLNHSGVKESVAIAHDLKQFIDKNRNKELPEYTLSFGIAQLKVNENIEEWMRRADKALYASKENGRNQITAAH